jgi:hypothetical protein
MVRDIRRPYRAKAIQYRYYSRSAAAYSQDGIVLLEYLDIVRRHVTARALVSLRTPVELGEVDGELADLFRGGVYHLHAGRDDLGSDPVCADLSDLVYALALR